MKLKTIYVLEIYENMHSAAFVARAAAAPVAPPPPNGFQNASATTAPATARMKKRRKKIGLASKRALPNERDDERTY